MANTRPRARTRAPLLWAVLVLGVTLWVSVFACGGSRGADGAGGQSGDEGVAPRGAGGGVAEPPAAR